MKFYIKLEKAVKTVEPPKKDEKGNKKRGDVRGGGYIKRVVTGQDKDGSPQDRYIRSQEELDAYEAGKKTNKPKESEGSKKLKDKTSKGHEDSTSKVKDKDKKTKKSIRFVIKKGA
mgnify:CR=1 FL=1